MLDRPTCTNTQQPAMSFNPRSYVVRQHNQQQQQQHKQQNHPMELKWLQEEQAKLQQDLRALLATSLPFLPPLAQGLSSECGLLLEHEQSPLSGMSSPNSTLSVSAPKFSSFMLQLPGLQTPPTLNSSARLTALLENSAMFSSKNTTGANQTLPFLQQQQQQQQQEQQQRLHRLLDMSSNVYPTGRFTLSPKEQHFAQCDRDSMLAQLQERLAAVRASRGNNSGCGSSTLNYAIGGSHKRSRDEVRNNGTPAPAAKRSHPQSPPWNPSRYRYMCKYPDCGKGAKAGGRCISHGGGKRCVIPDCSHIARFVGGRCHLHRDAKVPAKSDDKDDGDDDGKIVTAEKS